MESTYSIGLFASNTSFVMSTWGVLGRSGGDFESWNILCMVLRSLKELETMYLVNDLTECSRDTGTLRTQKGFVAGNTRLLGAHHCTSSCSAPCQDSITTRKIQEALLSASVMKSRLIRMGGVTAKTEIVEWEM